MGLQCRYVGKVVLQFMIYVLLENIYFKQLYNTITISWSLGIIVENI